jgi:CheY-like chemotaxis protein
MVFGVMKQNNGFINIYSEPGEGTTITLYFPRHAGAPMEEDSRKPEKLPEGRGETVLVVEDDAMVLSMAKKMLENLGYRVMSAATPAEALRHGGTRSGDIDLVMMDVIMPEMNGRELSEKLREHCPGIRVLFMSGYTANVIAHHGILDEGVLFIQKPFSRKDLAVKVREALGE